MCDRGLPEPDLVCYLEVCVETVMNRAQWGESRYDEKNFQFKVKENFNRLRTGKWGRYSNFHQILLKSASNFFTSNII